MKKIKLTKGAYALVDDADYKELSKHRWYLSSEGYAYRSIHIKGTRKHKNVSMHRQVMGVSDPKVIVDHRNENRVDNQRCNLRIANKSTNGCNRGVTKENKSGYKGVVLHGQCNRWMAQITVNGKNNYLGLYETKEEAAIAYNRAALVYFGEYASLNDV